MTSLVERFVSWLLVEKGYSPHTADGYQRDLADFLRFAGENLCPEAIPPALVLSFVG